MGQLFVVEFDRDQVEAYIRNSLPTKKKHLKVTLTITGKSKDSTVIQGSDQIRVIMPQH